MNYLKLFLPATAMLLLVVASHAQTDRQANIHLVNGKKVLGAVVTSYDDQTLTISVDGDTEFVLRYDLIKKIRFRGNDKISDAWATKIAPPASLRLHTYYHELRSGTLFGEENIDVSLHTLNGYQFNQYLGTALGVGLNKYGNYLTMPVYGQVKGFLLDRKVSPFYFGDIGYGFAWRNRADDEMFEIANVKGGLYWQIGLGYQLNFAKSALTFSFGYSSQASEARYHYQGYSPYSRLSFPGNTIGNGVEIIEKRDLRRFSVSVGFLF
ncbi:MAG: hypothetical protein HC819_10595 [Cyclobacteriaceae bacterium]|nr:hypothetical protein [Cyclobacteriaceae bacterium]